MALRPLNLPKAILKSPSTRPFSFAPAKSLAGKKYDGGDHVADRKDEKDVQSQASQSGMRKREEGDEQHSQALSERDTGAYTKKAEEQHPKAPKPVIGMTDERGAKGH